MKTRILLVNFSRKNLPSNINKNLYIDISMKHYPDNPHTRYYDWNWCKDEFVPPLNKKELSNYIQNPQLFREDLINNLKLYIRFCEYLKKQVPKIKKLPNDGKITSILVILFLFQSAMDNHYYRYDYPLDLEEYPKSPLGYHYLNIKDILKYVAEKQKINNKAAWINEQILTFLTKDGDKRINELRNYLDKNKISSLEKSYSAIQIYLKVQQEEEKIFLGKSKNKAVILPTGFAIWNLLKDSVNVAPSELFRQKTKLQEILDGDPIVGTRKILVGAEDLFSKLITKSFRKELEYWI